MKTTHILLAAILAATSVVQAATAEHKLPAPLPEFKTPEQLAVWRKEMAEKARAADALAAKQTNSAPATSAFYTGKPYVEETGTYAFKFRQYSPELSRWTSADPSGFPDGANNKVYVGSNVLCAFDPDGCVHKVLWLYAWKGNDTDTNSFTQFQNEYQSKWNELDALDTNQNGRYLNDGDWFDFNSISSISELGSFSEYDKVFLALHGWSSSMPESLQGTYRIGGVEGYGNRYTEAQIKAATSNIVTIMGCTGGSISAGDISAAFFGPTKKFLE